MSFPFRKRNNNLILLAVMLILAIVIGISFFFRGKGKVSQPSDEFEYVYPVKKEQIAAPDSVILLADGKAFLQKEARITPSESNKRELKVDGEVFFELADHPEPFIIHTRLLDLTVKGRSSLRVIAYSKEDGEEVQVLEGMVTARKAYPSDYPEPDTLRSNQLLMINISIDLMEKEKLDNNVLRQWRDSLDLKP